MSCNCPLRSKQSDSREDKEKRTGVRLAEWGPRAEWVHLQSFESGRLPVYSHLRLHRAHGSGDDGRLPRRGWWHCHRRAVAGGSVFLALRHIPRVGSYAAI